MKLASQKLEFKHPDIKDGIKKIQVWYLIGN